MSDFDRRHFLKGVLGKLALGGGTVLLASTVAPSAEAPTSEGTACPSEDIQKRADKLAATDASLAEAAEANEFLNVSVGNPGLGGFRNTPLGGFRNTPLGGFRNTPLGGFRNTPVGGFRNTPVGGFRNNPLGTFGNAGWPNGAFNPFRNGGWPNIGWPNGGWLNW
jgi:rSAM-associated Gly-rich repeat protein